MTATSAGGSTCLTAKGLDISLAALQRQDPYINNIVDVASQVALYTFNNRANEWEKTEVEGTLFVYTRLASPRHGFTIMNRLSMENLTEPITKDLDFQLQDPFLLYRNARLVIHGIWFYDKEDCQRIAQRMKSLTQQEQVLAQSQGGWLSPGGVDRGGGGGEGKTVDILQMLTKARSEYDKGGKLEPKEIGGGSSVLYDNPNLIKPIPVKPNTQDSEAGEPRSLSLATLFGSQPHRQPPPKPDPAVSPSGAPRTGSKVTKPGSGVRPAVARSLSYDDPAGAGGAGIAKGARGAVTGEAGVVDRTVIGGTVIMAGAGAGGVGDPKGVRGPVIGSGGEIGSPVGVRGALIAGQEGTSGIGGAGIGGPMCVRGPVIGGPEGDVPASPSGSSQQQSQPQHCPAIQKLMQGQRGGGEMLQTVSESPENRLCENGAPLQQQQLHHHHLHQHLHHQHHHHHHHQQQQHQHQIQADPIQRLFQTRSAPPTSSSSASPCCSHPPPLQQPPLLSSLQPAQPLLMDSMGYPHPHPQHSQPLFFSPSKPHPEAQPNNQSAHATGVSAMQGIVPTQAPGGMSAHSQVMGLQNIQGVPSQMSGVVSPHELLQRLQLVQQEQSLAVPDPPRPSPGLAPRFPAAAPTQGPGSALGPGHGPNQPTAAAGHKANLQFQVISPQRIPATVPPTMLLSPSVFTQARASGGGGGKGVAPQDGCPPPCTARHTLQEESGSGLSKSQLQATLLHLIQNDSSFLDTIYEAYVSRLARDTSNTH